MFFDIITMSPRRYSLNNSSRPSGSTETSTGSTAPTSPAPANSGGKTPNSQKSVSPGILLGISGGWLVARMFLLGGSLWILEIIAVIIAAGIAHSKGGKGQKVTSKIIIILAVLNFFIPGFNSWVKGIRDNQLNPPEEMSPIVINRDGEYELPNRPLKVCFTMTGDPVKNFYVDQQVIIEGIWQEVQRGTGCKNLPDSVNGKKVKISLGIPGKQYTAEIKNKWGLGEAINNEYDYYRVVGVSAYPIIQAR